MANLPARLNPYRSFKEWGRVQIGKMFIPGFIKTIDGAEKPEEWAVQKGLDVSHAVTIWRGTKLAESIKIVTELPDEASFDLYYDFRDMMSPKIGRKPPVLPIVNAAINFSGITRVSRVVVPPPKPAPGLSWQAEIIVIEYRPPQLAKVGPADPPKAKTENDVLADQLAEVVAQARKIP